MGVIKRYNGRKFVESDFYAPIVRHIAGLSSNNIWLYTVEKALEVESQKVVIRIIRWRARNDEKDKNIKYWRTGRRNGGSYNVRSSEEWGATSQIVDVLIDSKMSDDNFVLLPKGEYEKILGQQDKVGDLHNKIKKLKTVDSAKDVELSTFKQKLKLMKANIKSYEQILNEFKSLIENLSTTETDVHKFIFEKKAYWLFGLEYVDINSKVRFPPGKRDYEFDIMLKRRDGFLDLVELKGPNENLFDKRTGKRSKPNKALSEAIGQVFTYLHACDTSKFKNILKPKAKIIIGKEKTDKVRERRIFQSYLNNVELITYTDLLKQGRSLLNYIKSATLA